MIYLGSDKQIKDAKLGDKQVQSLYLGNGLVWKTVGDYDEYGYIKSGKVFHLDGINKGNDETKWTDLIGGIYFTLTTHSIVNDDNIQFDGKGYINGNKNINVPFTQGTIEVCVDGTASGCLFITASAQGFSFMFGSNGYTVKPSQSPSNQFTYSGHKYNKLTGSFISSFGLVNGNKLTTKSTNNWNQNRTYPSIGGRSNGTAYYFTGKIHSIRLYDRQLTEEEMKHNQQIDNTRFNLGLTLQ